LVSEEIKTFMEEEGFNSIKEMVGIVNN